MVKKGGYTIENIYQSNYSAFEPTSFGTGTYPIKTGSLGLTLNPQVFNVLKEVSEKANTGIKQVEMEAISPQFLDNVPKQQMEEVRRLSKLTGVNVSVHGPVIDTTGVDPRRGGYSESERVLAEKKILQTLERSHELNPDGNIPVNFHSAEGLPGSEFLPPAEREKRKQEFIQETMERIDHELKERSISSDKARLAKERLLQEAENMRFSSKIIAVNRETGELAPLETEKRFYPGQEKIREETMTPEERLNSLNATKWDNSLFQVEVNRERAEEILKDVHPIIISRFIAHQYGKIPEEEVSREEMNEMNKVGTAYQFVKQAKLAGDTLFSQAYEIAKKDNDLESLKLLSDYSKRYGELMGINKDGKMNPERALNPLLHAQALRDLRETLHRAQPQTFIPIENFALEKSSQTYGNAAYESYKQFKDNSPILTIENPPAGFALSTGEDLAKLVKQSRKQFVKRMVEEGKSEREAEKLANKFIGATLDVGHMNMLRKYGYSEEDIVKESAKLAPMIKHVHLSDNFGFDHTELPMGMGNVPFKQIMEKLGQKGYDARKIIEAGQWWQQFGGAPLLASLEQMGTPIYSGRVAPYWNQNIGFHQNYFAGYGLMLPQINYETFGAGFSQLPMELGGQRAGAQGSRMSGRPME